MHDIGRRIDARWRANGLLATVMLKAALAAEEDGQLIEVRMPMRADTPIIGYVAHEKWLDVKESEDRLCTIFAVEPVGGHAQNGCGISLDGISARALSFRTDLLHWASGILN